MQKPDDHHPLAPKDITEVSCSFWLNYKKIVPGLKKGANSGIGLWTVASAQ
jgi:hypothetical protein